jgi:hypothetical protein
MVYSAPTFALQTSEYIFHIFLGSKEVGYLKFSETAKAGNRQIRVYSKIDTWLIFRYTATGEETYHYRNDTLVSSHLYRKINNRVRLKQNIVRQGTGYLITGPELNKTFEGEAVRINLTRLFLEEPVGIDQIFSDRFGEWVPLVKTGEHEYRVTLPNGSRTIFTYRDRRCHSVVSMGFFYKVHLVPQGEMEARGS